MFNCREALCLLALVLGFGVSQAQPFTGIGRAATPQEVAAWDIDVRADFKGLPAGSGNVAKGQVIWEDKCASCHGIFGESNEVFTPLVGGTTAQDIQTGRVARLTDPSFPGRTTFMKLPTLSTLWDYINRAMPWNAPKSLTTDEVYALTAFMLNLAGIVPDDFTLSDRNMPLVQARLPNRNGMTTAHNLWPGNRPGATRKADVLATACMDNCAPVRSATGNAPSSVASRVASQLPDFARNAHGNLAEQNRLVGAQRGVNTAGANAVAAKPTSTPHPALALAQQHNCLTCHGMNNKIVGPALNDVARKYAGRADALAYLTQRIKGGGAGVWGAIPMPEQTLPSADAQAIAQWLVDSAKPQ
jgi:S-disulfanyl-L-cysteine oxidoreductase SoxD